MLRLTEITLPLDHDEAALVAAILARLGIGAGDLSGYHVARRSYDARTRGAIALISAVDVDTPREPELLQKNAHAPAPARGPGRPVGKLMPTPDTSYRF